MESSPGSGNVVVLCFPRGVERLADSSSVPFPYSLVVGVEVATSGADVVATGGGGGAAAGWTAGAGTGDVIELLPGSAAEEESVAFPSKEKVAAAVGGFRASAVVVVVGAWVDDADTTVGCLEGPGRAAAGAVVPGGLGTIAAVAGGFFVVLVIVLGVPVGMTVSAEG